MRSLISKGLAAVFSTAVGVERGLFRLGAMLQCDLF